VHKFPSTEKRLLLIWTKRAAYVIGKFGVTLGAAAPGGGVTFTSKSTPAYAELVPISMLVFFCRLTSVRRPITAEGLTTNTLPLPLLVFIPALRVPAQTFPLVSGMGVHPLAEQSVPDEQIAPPVIAPVPLFSTQWVLPVFPNVKFPLLCAEAIPVANTAINSADVK
jgi:hypothetical protein